MIILLSCLGSFTAGIAVGMLIVKIIKNYPIVTVTVDNTTILHCQFLRKLDNRLVAQVEFESTLYGF